MKEEIDYIAKKKSIHINLTETEHRQLRSELFLNGLNMNQFFQFIVQKLNNKEESMQKVLQEISQEIKNNELDALRRINRQDLYDLIENNSPQDVDN